MKLNVFQGRLCVVVVWSGLSVLAYCRFFYNCPSFKLAIFVLKPGEGNWMSGCACFGSAIHSNQKWLVRDSITCCSVFSKVAWLKIIGDKSGNECRNVNEMKHIQKFQVRDTPMYRNVKMDYVTSGDGPGWWWFAIETTICWSGLSLALTHSNRLLVGCFVYYAQAET